MQQFGQIAIIGMGLIGGSLALALKNAGYKGRIIGCDLSPEALEEGLAMVAIDAATQDLKEAVIKAELVIIATPVGFYSNIFQEIAEALSKDTIVTDVGSVKGYVSRTAASYLPEDIQFVGGHPMAGSEKGGIKAATPFLFQNAYYFLTAKENTKQDTIEKLEGLVRSIGAFPVVVESNQHDKIVGQISHIPHMMAVMLANMLERRNTTDYAPFAGGGFRDTTRIAAGNPHMWKDIFFFNKEEVLEGVTILEEMLQEFKEMLAEEKEEEVLSALQKAKRLRDSIPHGKKDYIPQVYDLILDVEDRPGVLGELTQIIGKHAINIKEIEILHAREGEAGAVRIAVASKEEQDKAYAILRNGKFPLTYRKGESKEDANNS
ncbi:prephenate dehydrogenase [Natronincola peptidivorans]|uniref:Prephenate dehydrogenase n=1 Tax=Natronincola peptidivorans TaxID=426128 RepID=A0A1I0A4Q0_9FIRM|nr:prephenate dehydrogenase [Natronincola peptidivorans]SES89065.1 prephenate dehydrogenase [Natronincola peptidivorans]